RAADCSGGGGGGWGDGNIGGRRQVCAQEKDDAAAQRRTAEVDVRLRHCRRHVAERQLVVDPRPVLAYAEREFAGSRRIDRRRRFFVADETRFELRLV